jgi:threonine synthase
MKFIETRGNDGINPLETTFSEAILSPIASFGGLYVPKELAALGETFLSKHLGSSYKELASDILATLDIDIDSSVIAEALSLYDKFDDPSNPVPVVKVRDDLYVSELYHGPTRAFKDMALQPFGVVLSSLAQKRGQEYLILAATSGDTGPAALETFKNRPNVRVVCLYPDGGTSDVQRLQMVTEDAPNLKVIGIHGDFDDAQSALKRLLSSESFNAALKTKNIELSAANSVNFGRIIFQTIYHVHSYLELVRQDVITMGEKVYLNVPSGNFGNALGGYYATKMGLPVEKIIIASNENNVLTRLINTGRYDLRGEKVVPTTSPAMDILISSNVERILFDFFGAQRTKELMKLQELFAADYCNGAEGKGYIKEAYDTGYLMDPHTATCFKAYDCCATKSLKTIVYSTAEWTKFSPTIANALTGENDANDIDALKSIAHTAKIAIPSVIQELFSKPVVQDTVIDKEDIEAEILKFL